MKKHEVSKEFNGYIAEIMAEGFNICMTELTGSYSDVEGTQTVFAKGRERVVLWMTRSRDYSDNPEEMTLHAARFEMAKDERMDWNYNWSDNWAEHIVWEKSAWKVADDWYTFDQDEALDAAITRHEHWARSHRDRWGYYKNVEMTDKLFAIVRRVKGFKTAKREDVVVSKHTKANRWNIRNAKTGTEVTIKAA